MNTKLRLTGVFAVLLSTSLFIGAPAFALGVNLNVILKPVQHGSNASVNGQHITGEIYLALDPTVPAGNASRMSCRPRG